MPSRVPLGRDGGKIEKSAPAKDAISILKCREPDNRWLGIIAIRILSCSIYT
jgi:hypothetical protein